MHLNKILRVQMRSIPPLPNSFGSIQRPLNHFILIFSVNWLLWCVVQLIRLQNGCLGHVHDVLALVVSPILPIPVQQSPP